LGVVYLFGEKSISDVCTIKAKEYGHYLQRVLSAPHKPGFTEPNPCSSIHFWTLYNWTATRRHDPHLRRIQTYFTASATEAVAAFNALALQGSKTGTEQEPEQEN